MIVEAVGGPQNIQSKVQKMDIESPVEGCLASVQPKLSAKDF